MSDLVDSFRAIVLASIPWLKWYGRYDCVVVAQNADGTLELKPEDPSVPAHSAVPIQLGLPDVKVKVPPGTHVMQSFTNGDPKRPFAELLFGSAIEIAFNGGTAPLGRVGDQVKVTIPASTVIIAVVSGAGTPNPLPIDLIGTIQAGSPKLKG